MTLHIVKHVKTGITLPTMPGRNGMGGSHWDPTEKDYDDSRPPRIFPTVKSAKSFISAWAQGRHFVERSYNSYSGESDEIHRIKDMGRRRTELQAVPVRIVELLSELEND